MNRQRLGMIFVLLLSGLIQTDVCRGDRIFVSQRSEASDHNMGTRRKPLRTIAAAIEKAEPGDVVLVGSGDYRTEDSGWGTGVIPIVDKGGARRIQVRSMLGACVLVNQFLVRDSENVSIRGFQFRSLDFSQFPNWRDMPTVVVKDPNFDRPDYFEDFSTRKELIENQFETYFELLDTLDFTSAIDIERSSGIRVSNNSIDGYWAGIQCRQCKKILIQFNCIRHTANGIFTLLSEALVDSKIRFNFISQSLDNGIDIRGQSCGIVVAGNMVMRSGRAHISFQDGVSQSDIKSNFLYSGGHYSETMEFPGSSAISVNSSGSKIRILGNYISNQVDSTLIDGNGIILDFIQDGKRVLVRNNFAIGNQGSGINTTESPNALIRNNWFVRNKIGIKLSRDQDVNQTLVGNLILFNSFAGIQTSLNLDQQKNINRNVYLKSRGVPIVLDGEPAYGTFYFSIDHLRAETGWEKRGAALILGR